ncbi:unnamed protein product [Trichogramma brassicae]|uniref:PI3K-RBD domain-containing protein n=1 Tax=Trichogramma brassicae TaxID=86971 RepID=A0A6H5I5Y9_9HYME|nr:unnamed protein product [Trichogramma brassicae]
MLFLTKKVPRPDGSVASIRPDGYGRCCRAYRPKLQQQQLARGALPPPNERKRCSFRCGSSQQRESRTQYVELTERVQRLWKARRGHCYVPRMSNYNRNSNQRAAVIDYDRQFQEDLERAQALSLESLALEKFRIQKQQQQLQSSNNGHEHDSYSSQCTVSVTGGNSSENDAPVTDNKLQLRSRPRPGSNSNQSRNAMIVQLQPPPIPTRRNSSNQAQSADLINFTSPVKQDSLTEYCTAPPPLPLYIPPLPTAYRPAITAGSASAAVAAVPSVTATTPVLSNNAVPALTYGPQQTDDNNQLSVLKVIEKKANSNLIDLTAFEHLEDRTNVRVSVLEAFDPLLERSEESDYACLKGCNDDSRMEGSVYDPFDPFDYMYSTSETVNSDPVYAAVDKSAKSPAASPAAPPPLPPRNSSAWNTIERRKTSLDRRQKRQTRLYENVQVTKTRASLHDPDLLAFHKMVKSVRGEFPFNDPSTNIGHIVSTIMESTYPENTSVKLIVHPKMLKNSIDTVQSISFTCDVTCSVEHVILNVACSLEDENTVNADQFCLRVWGLAEYLAPNTILSQYEYVHQCIKLEKDIEFAIETKVQMKKSIARTLQDDNRDQCLKLEDLLPQEPAQPISYDTLLILLAAADKRLGPAPAPGIHPHGDTHPIIGLELPDYGEKPHFRGCMNNYQTNDDSQMTSSGIGGVTMDAVSYVQKALLPGQTNPEAAATFARMIESSLKSWFTQFNFFLHNLAQLRFSGDHSEGELLSFIPRTYT